MTHEPKEINVITISREYHAGGGEVARRLAGALGWQLADRELLHRAATIESVTDDRVQVIDEAAPQAFLHFHPELPQEHYIHGLSEAARQAAARGNVILVGRGTRHLIGYAPNYLHLRLVAPFERRVERTAALNQCSIAEAETECREVDDNRSRFLRHYFGSNAVAPVQFDLVVNTGRVALDDVVAGITALIRDDWPLDTPLEIKRVATMSRELGAAYGILMQELAERLHVKVFDREILEQEALRLGVTVQDLEQIDEQPGGLFQRIIPGSLFHRYRAALEKYLRELAEQGDALIVGRGSNGFLRNFRNVFHARCMAAFDARLIAVMNECDTDEAGAKKLIARSDEQRARFYENNFGGNWSDPLAYHISVNTGRLQASAPKTMAFFAQQHWKQHHNSIRAS